MLQLSNVALQDSYVAETTLESEYGGRLVYLIANASAVVQYRPQLELGGSGTAAYTAEIVVPPQTGVIDKISAVRFKNAEPGKIARVICQLAEPGDILPAAGTPFSAILSASGGAAGLVGVPVGMIAQYGGATDPVGWLICDGRAVSRAIYAALFLAIGTTYGPGDGSTTFNIPDGRGRKLVGLGTHADVSTLGNSEGAALAARRQRHKHTTNLVDPGHAHNVPTDTGAGGQLGGAARVTCQFAGSVTDAQGTGISISVGPQTGNEPVDAGAYLVTNHIIATGV